jgi:hypothetical protein
MMPAFCTAIAGPSQKLPWVRLVQRPLGANCDRSLVSRLSAFWKSPRFLSGVDRTINRYERLEVFPGFLAFRGNPRFLSSGSYDQRACRS